MIPWSSQMLSVAAHWAGHPIHLTKQDSKAYTRDFETRALSIFYLIWVLSSGLGAPPPLQMVFVTLQFCWSLLLHVFCHITQAIIELQKHLSWKRRFRSSSPTITPVLPNSPLNHAPKCHSYTALKSLQEWWLHHCSKQPVLWRIFPNIQTK